MTESLTIRRPDDWHVHLRDGEMLRSVVGHTARQFARANQALSYSARICHEPAMPAFPPPLRARLKTLSARADFFSPGQCNMWSMSVTLAPRG